MSILEESKVQSCKLVETYNYVHVVNTDIMLKPT